MNLDYEKYINCKIDLKMYFHYVVLSMNSYGVNQLWISDFDVKVDFTFSPKAQYCYTNIISSKKVIFRFSPYNILEAMYEDNCDDLYCEEYDHIAADSHIGSTNCMDWKHAVIIECAHEMAHVFDFCANNFAPAPIKNYFDPNPDNCHGPRWQDFYYRLRLVFTHNVPDTVLAWLNCPYVPSTDQQKRQGFISLRDFHHKHWHTYYWNPDRTKFLGVVKHTDKCKVAYGSDSKNIGNFKSIYRARKKILNTAKR